MNRPDQMDGNDALAGFEHFGKMSDGTAQRPVAEDVALLKPGLGIEGMQVLPAGCLALPGEL